ncbi:MAG: phosphoethanolamine transferase [Muribaculaceae bacterium]|nr:phosphoethanolamine transferase [Muribaculaceae bacterium]
MPKSSSPDITFLRFWIITVIAYAVVFTILEFIDSPVAGLTGFANIAGHWTVVTLFNAALFGLLALNRVVFAVTFPPIISVSGILTYYHLTMRVMITPQVVELAAVNDVKTCLTVVTPLLVVVALLCLAIGIVAAVVRWRRVRTPSRWYLWAPVCMVVVIVPFLPTVAWLYNPISVRMPMSVVCSTATYLANRSVASEHRDTFDSVAVQPDSVQPEVIFVIGESTRADHLSLNGYQRDTTPLMRGDTATVSFPEMHTIPCFTHTSVPHLVTRADSLHPQRALTEQSFITLLRKAGYHTAWISNQDMVKTFAYFMHEADTLLYGNAAKSLYNFDKWMDTDMLPLYDSLALPEGTPRLTVFHTIGAHWWYRSHYPDSLAKFKPETDSRIFSELTREQIVNSYDNAILATDLFLHSLTTRLRDRDAVIIYISDHGEALGEEGRYLHPTDWPELHNPGCLIWYSAEYARRRPEKVEALKRNASRRVLSDVMFHTVLDAAGIKTSVLDPEKSLMRQ